MSATAQPFTNGDFEAPFSSGWLTSGDVRRETSGTNHYAAIYPTGNLWQGFTCGAAPRVNFSCRMEFSYFASEDAQFKITVSQLTNPYRSIVDQPTGGVYRRDFVDGPCGQVTFSIEVTRGVVGIDNIVASCVPEPGVLAGLALGVIGLARRRRSRKPLVNP